MAELASASESLLEQIGSLKATGEAATVSGDPEAAIKAFSAAVKLLPYVPDPEDSEDEWEGDPPAGDVLKLAGVVGVLLSEAQLGAKKHIQALAAAQKAARCDPSNWKAHWQTGLSIMLLQPKITRSKMAVKAFEMTLALQDQLTEEEIANAKTALERAQTRLQKGRDDLPMPEGCVLC